MGLTLAFVIYHVVQARVMRGRVRSRVAVSSVYHLRALVLGVDNDRIRWAAPNPI